MAFQNPATIQGNVIVNKMISAISIALKPAGDNATAARTINATMETANNPANIARRPEMEFPAVSACLD
jgi:hypothetical protein